MLQCSVIPVLNKCCFTAPKISIMNLLKSRYDVRSAYITVLSSSEISYSSFECEGTASSSLGYSTIPP